MTWIESSLVVASFESNGDGSHDEVVESCVGILLVAFQVLKFVRLALVYNRYSLQLILFHQAFRICSTNVLGKIKSVQEAQRR